MKRSELRQIIREELEDSDIKGSEAYQRAEYKGRFGKEMPSLFQVYELDMDGRKIYRYMGVFRANSKEEARKIASEYYNDQEIITTGYYDAQEISQKELGNIRTKLEKEIKNRTQILN